MSLASTTAYRPNITKLAPQTMETKQLKETYGRVYEALKLHQEQTFLGVRFGQNPSDAQVIQEIVSEVKPALIIETGTNTGGSALWLSVLLEAVRPSAKIVTIDQTHIEEWMHRDLPQPGPTQITILGASRDRNKRPIHRRSCA